MPASTQGTEKRKRTSLPATMSASSRTARSRRTLHRAGKPATVAGRRRGHHQPERVRPIQSSPTRGQFAGKLHRCGPNEDFADQLGRSDHQGLLRRQARRQRAAFDLLDVQRYAADRLFTPGRRPQALFDLFLCFQCGHTPCNTNHRHSGRAPGRVIRNRADGRADRNADDVFASHSQA